MARKTLLTLSVSATLATILLAPTAVFAQFPGPPPMGPGGPPPIAAGGPPAPPPMGAGGAARAGFGGPAPRLGAGAGSRGDLRAFGGVRAGGRDGPAVARSIEARSASVSDSRYGSFSHGYGGRRYGYGAAYVAGAYAGYAYGSSDDGNYSDSDCYHVYRHHRRILVCNYRAGRNHPANHGDGRKRLGFAGARDGDRFVNRSCATKRPWALRQRVEPAASTSPPRRGKASGELIR